jgi:hypothetical protein
MQYQRIHLLRDMICLAGKCIFGSIPRQIDTARLYLFDFRGSLGWKDDVRIADRLIKTKS